MKAESRRLKAENTLLSLDASNARVWARVSKENDLLLFECVDFAAQPVFQGSWHRPGALQKTRAFKPQTCHSPGVPCGCSGSGWLLHLAARHTPTGGIAQGLLQGLSLVRLHLHDQRCMGDG